MATISNQLSNFFGGLESLVSGKQQEKTNLWPTPSDHQNTKTHISNIQKILNPKTRRSQKAELDRLKIEQKRERERLRLQHWLYETLYSSYPGFRTDLEQIAKELKINPGLNLQNIHFLGKEGIAQEKELKLRLQELHAQYLQRDTQLYNEYNLYLIRVDIEVATDFYNLQFFAECWRTLAQAHFFLRSNSSNYPQEELSEYLTASYHLIYMIWKTQTVYLNDLTLQDLAWYCLQHSLIHESVIILTDLLRRGTLNSLDLSWVWSMLGKAKSYLPRPNSQEVQYLFQRSLEFNQKIQDPRIRLQKQAEIFADEGLAMYNLGLLHQAEEYFGVARERMLEAIAMDPSLWSQQFYDQKIAEIAHSQARISVERLRQTGNLERIDYQLALDNLKSCLNIYQSLHVSEWVHRTLELAKEFKKLAEYTNPLFALKIKSFVDKNIERQESVSSTDKQLAWLNYSMTV